MQGRKLKPPCSAVKLGEQDEEKKIVPAEVRREGKRWLGLTPVAYVQ